MAPIFSREGIDRVVDILADARPEKRLFISLITRDISLIDAFLDLLDNSINAALEPLSDRLKTADDYEKLLANTRIRPSVRVELTVTNRKITVRDTAPGISADTAAKHVFRFGRDAGTHESDRLSVYGIGLKRAIFKCGNKIEIISDHRDGGFELELDAAKWEKTEEWKFRIRPREPVKKDFGTTIVLTQLH